jgi:hypothetical protein
MKIKLRIQYLEKIPRKKFHGQKVLTEILIYLNEQSLLEKINYLSLNNSPRKKEVKSASSLIEESRSWKEGIFELSAYKENPHKYLIKAKLDDSTLWFYMSLGDDVLPHFSNTILQQWKQLLIALNKNYFDSLFFGPLIAVEIYDFKYPKLRPERDHPLIKNDQIISIFSRKFQQEHPEGNIKELDRLLKAKLPPSATVEKQGDLIFFNWTSAGDLADEKKLKKRLIERDRFLAEELNAPIAGGRNEFGDEEVPTAILSGHPPLTFYDEFSKSGYKAVVVDKKGKGADEEIGKLAEWVKAGKLPDKTPVESAGIIVPGREQALAVRKRAQAAGIEDVFYVDNDGRWWNPFSSD